MPTPRGLSVYLYTPPGSNYYGQYAIEIGSSVTRLDFSSASPGGYTDFHATLPIRDGRIPFPAFTMFAQIEIKSGLTVVWAGELTDPELNYDEKQGEYLQLTGLGLGNALRDWNLTTSYTNATVRSIARSELSLRNNPGVTNALPTISTDNTALFPDNPATLFSPVYDTRNLEDILSDLCALAGDYAWGVWAHPALAQSNTLGFRLGQVWAHQRDTSTTTYSASLAQRDVQRLSVGPTAERAYNNIAIDVNTATSSPTFGSVTTVRYKDSRLATDGSQNNAPFRSRMLSRDYTGVTTITQAMAQAIANTYGAEYQNPSNKFTATLRRVYDANGAPIPLAEVLADGNLFIRDMAQRGVGKMPTTPTAGVNQFYLVSATYREDQNDATLEVEGDNFYDRAETQITRLSLQADALARSGKTTGVVQKTGASVTGYAAMGQTNPTSGQVLFAGMQWPVALFTVPTSVAFSQLVRTNLNTPSAAQLTSVGGIVQAAVSVSANCEGAWTYVTSGNCLRAIHSKTFDWHCDSCGKEFRGLSLNEHIHIQTGRGAEPGTAGLAVTCPECAGFTESFNTALRSEDERHVTHKHRAEQARLIRQLMCHGAVGLEVAD